MPLRMTDKKTIKRFDDGDVWIELRVGGLTKGESDDLADVQTSMSLDAPDGVVSPGDAQRIEINRRIAEANQKLFSILCKDWSLDIDPSEEAYGNLDTESGRWIDECIADVLAERNARAEGNPTGESSPPDTSKKRSARGSSSPKAQD